MKSTHPGADRSTSRLLAVVALFSLLLLDVLPTAKIKILVIKQQKYNKTLGIKQQQQQQQTTTLERRDESNPVRWVYDDPWFQEQAKGDCCPFSVPLYETRYSDIHNRCCTDRWHEIEPLRAIGGISSWKHFRNLTIFLQGDSLAEQHFLALLCNGWNGNNKTSEADWRLELIRGKRSHPTTTYKAVQSLYNVTLIFFRWNEVRPHELADPFYPHADFVILGGFHHGVLTKPKLSGLVTHIQSLRPNRDQATVLISEALPGHFPQGKKFNSGVFPPAKVLPHAIRKKEKLGCDMLSNISTPRGINAHLEEWGFPSTILRIHHLYKHRGDAHIGYLPKRYVHKRADRDCVHWCVAPGVLDAWTRVTLAAMHAAANRRQQNTEK